MIESPKFMDLSKPLLYTEESIDFVFERDLILDLDWRILLYFFVDFGLSLFVVDAY